MARFSGLFEGWRWGFGGTTWGGLGMDCRSWVLWWMSHSVTERFEVEML